MAKTKTPKFFAHEEMIAQWEKAGRVVNTDLSIKTLVLDEENFQARVGELDVKHVADLEVNLVEGRQLAPIIVFEIDEKNVVGDGFHRTEAHVRNKKRAINAKVVKDATRQEAIEYATCCNMANMSKKMNPEDKKKAVFMLLDAGWLHRTASEIGRHTGTSGSTVAKYRAEYCEKTGSQIPDTVINRAWHAQKTSRSGSTSVGPKVGRDKRMERKFKAKVAGKRLYVAADTKEEAEAKIADAITTRATKFKTLGSTASITSLLSVRGLWYDVASSPSVIQGGKCVGFAVTSEIEDVNALRAPGFAFIAAAIGRAVLLGRHYGLERKIVLVPEALNGYVEILDLAKGLGVEFMTLDQFVDAVKADEGEAGAAVAV